MPYSIKISWLCVLGFFLLTLTNINTSAKAQIISTAETSMQSLLATHSDTLYLLAENYIKSHFKDVTIKTKFGVTINTDKYANTTKGYPAHQVIDKTGKTSVIMLEFIKNDMGWHFLKRIKL